MATSKAAKLNNYGITCMPVAFLSKDWRNKQDGAENFKPKNRKRSLLPTRKFILNVINKIRSQYGSLVKLTYKLFESQTNIKHTTIWRSLKELEADNIIKCNGESDYEINQTYTDNEFIVLYDFLFNEVLDLGGKVAKQLSRNAIIFLCHLIGFYLNTENKYNYFKGGDKRTASFLNVAQGTANGIIHELTDTKAIYSYAAKKDEHGNLVKVKNKKKGKSNAEFTIYEVNPKLLSRCKRIQQYYAEIRKKKAEETQQANQAIEQTADVITDNGEEIFIKPKKAKAKTHNTPKHPRRSITEEWAEIFKKLKNGELELSPPNNIT